MAKNSVTWKDPDKVAFKRSGYNINNHEKSVLHKGLSLLRLK